MTRVFVVCEGPTEMTFVRELIQPEFPLLTLSPFLPGKMFGRPSGGDVRYSRIRPDIVTSLKQDRGSFCTTFLDFYGLGEFPSLEEPRGQDPEARAARIELAVAEDVAEELGDEFNPSRFRAYFSMHEFEGLLFSDPQRLAQGLYRPEIEPDLVQIRLSFPTPEHIDDDPETAPSKRLLKVCAGYDKVTGGNLAAIEVGMATMRRECAHFRGWLAWIESVQTAARNRLPPAIDQP